MHAKDVETQSGCRRQAGALVKKARGLQRGDKEHGVHEPIKLHVLHFGWEPSPHGLDE